MSSQYQVRRRQTTRLGRSGPRSKNGCQTCKTRRVRCDEKHPECSHCLRLQLECTYGSMNISRRNAHRSGDATQSSGAPTSLPSPVSSYQFDESGGINERGATTSNGSSTAVEPTDTPQQLYTHDDNYHGSNDLGCVPNSTTMVSIAHMNVLNTAETVGSLWHNGQPDHHLDYVSVPDPPFIFTSLEFENSPTLFTDYSNTNGSTASGTTGINVQSWFDNAPDPQRFDRVTTTSTTLEKGQMDSLLQEDSNGQSPETSPLVPFISVTQQQTCLTYFDRDVRPPASLAGIDPVGWWKIKGYILEMARSANKVMLNAFFAITTLLSATDMTFQSSVNRHNYKLLAIRLHQAACGSIKLTLTKHDWVPKYSQDLLAAVFLLVWFEIAYDDDDPLRPSYPSELAATVIVSGRGWRQSSKYLLQWLNLMDSRKWHPAGRFLFSESAFQVIRQAHFEISRLDITDDDHTYHSEHSEHESSEVSEKLTMMSPHSKRLEYLLSSRSQSAPPSNVIRMDVLNIILHPAFEFHLSSMSFARRISCHDRHNRPRFTPEDEYEVMEACRGFEEGLQELWRHRPGILSLDASQLEQFVSKDIARELEVIFSVYIATFWCHFIYIHRVAFWALKHNAITEKALMETGNMMRRSVGQPMDCLAFDESIARTVANTIHPGLMWTCMIFGIEIQDPVQQNWCIAQLRALGMLSLSDYKNHCEATNDVLPLRIDKRGQQNAVKVSVLLREVIDRQEKTKTRVDGRLTSLELFGCSFYLI
ncbi:hypothetical protein F4802DRAFT_587326 [Xylaria palmicola]|nr:hypothetical protein F4802DRAFT_587326 [Xylaria palmicola]